MSILFPQARLERGEFVSASEGSAIAVPGIILGTSPSNECNSGKFFGQILDVDLEYASLATFRTAKLPGNSARIMGYTKDKAVENGLNIIENHYYNHNVFKNIISPIFTAGGIRTITRETGNYQEYAGQMPSELTFSVKGINNNMVYWARTHMTNIRPMSMGVYLRNTGGDILGLMVGTNTSNTPAPSQPTRFAFLPIPILGFRKTATLLGGFENPDLMGFSILFPPNWESPYQTGSIIDNYEASLSTLTNRLGMIQFSVPCIVPKAVVDEYTEYIN